MEGNSTEFISLSEAASYCNYSQDYLNLLARKGYLKAVKIGRNWVTKREWLLEYIDRVEKKRGLVVEDELPKAESVERPDDLLGRPTAALPETIKKSDFFKWLEVINKLGFTRQAAAFLIVFFIFTGLFFGLVFLINNPELRLSWGIANLDNFFLSSTKKSGQAVNDFTLGISGKINNIFAASYNITNNLSDRVSNKLSRIAEKTKKIARDAVNFLLTGKTEKIFVFNKTAPIDRNVLEARTNLLESDIIDYTKVRFDGFRQDFGINKTKTKAESGEIISGEPQKGIIVIPSTDKNEEAKAKIKASFSDEVEVKPSDEDSGIIIPEFKEKKGEEYLYMMVPVYGGD